MSSAFAIAAGVVGVAGAATAAGISMSASDRAAKASSRQGKKYQQQLRAATDEFNRNQDQLKNKINKIDPSLNIPQYNLQDATVEGIKAANRVTQNTLQQIEKIAPGSAGARQQTGNIIASYLRGEVPQDVQDQTMRMIAERGGAGFNIATAGRGAAIQAPQADFARSIGSLSSEYQRMGMEANWRNVAEAFRFYQQPSEMMQFGLQGRGQDITVAQAEQQNQFQKLGMISNINTGRYNALTGQAQQVYDVGQQNIQNTLAARQAVGQGVQSISSATSGALMGMSGAAGGVGAAGGGGAYSSSFAPMGEMASASQYATGARGYGLAGSLQNLYMGQLGRPATSSAMPSDMRQLIYGR
jgi:hypothetical protein